MGQQVGWVTAQQGDQQFERAAMGDDDDRTFGVAELGGEGADAGQNGGTGFAAGRGEAERVGGPAVEIGAGDVVPRPAFPGPEIDFMQQRVDPWREVVGGTDGIGKEAAAQGGTGENGGRGEMSEIGDDRGDGGMAFGREAEIAAAIAEPRSDRRFGVAKQRETRRGGRRGHG